MFTGATLVKQRVVHMAAGALPAETLAVLVGPVREVVSQASGYPR